MKLTSRSVDDMKDTLLATFMSQTRMSYLRNVGGTAASGLTRKRKKTEDQAKSKKIAAEHSDPEFESFKKSVEQTRLKMWKSVMHTIIWRAA